MGFFDFLKQPDINQGVKQYKTTSGAILLDVRTPQEYAEGHAASSLEMSSVMEVSASASAPHRITTSGTLSPDISPTAIER